MMAPVARPDVLELTPEALIALSNAGFVKKAQRELAEGRLPELRETAAGDIEARFADGQLTRLPPGRSLRDATCSCPASGLCRHRVMLVLAYQHRAAEEGAPAATDIAWSPSVFVSALDSLPAATREQAGRLAAERPVLRLTAWQPQAPVPMARLPMCTVRFYSRHSLSHARCDCRQGEACAHMVLAVHAFARAEQHQPGFRDCSLAMSPEPVAAEGSDPAARQLADTLRETQAALDELALALWLDGTGQPMLGLETRQAALQHRLDTLGWCWAATELAELWQGIAAQHARSGRHDPGQLLRILSGVQSRLAAALHAVRQELAGELPRVPAAQILGLGIPGEVALDQLCLVSLGGEAWRTDVAEGVRLSYVDPDTLAVTVIERQWPRAGTAAAPVSLLDRRLAGHPVRALAAGQIITRRARRRANGLLDLPADARHTTVLPLSRHAWDALGAPLRQDSVAALRACLRDAGPDFVRPSQLIEQLHVLPVAAVLDWGWEAASQTLHARLCIGKAGEDLPLTDPVHLEYRHEPAAPGAVDGLARALAGELGAPVAVAGQVQLAAGRMVLKPQAWLAENRVLILMAESGPACALDRRPVPLRDSPALDCVNQTLHLLALCLRQGLWHQGEATSQRLREQAEALRAAGFVQVAASLEAVPTLLRSADRQSLPGRLAGIVQWLLALAREI